MIKKSSCPYFFYFIFILSVLTTCQTNKKESEINILHKLLKNQVSNEDINILSQQLDSLKITPVEVYQFCQEIKSYKDKMLLAAAVFNRVKNYEQENNADYWASIAYNLERFGEYVSFLKETKHKTFLDVGSGNGDKMYAALCLGFDKVYGLEYAPELVKITQKFFKPFSKLTNTRFGDALTVEKGFYQKSDFIYMFSPIKDNQTMAKLYYKIMQNMKEGSILMEVRMVYYKELRALTKLNFPDIEGFFAIKKEKGNFYYVIKHHNEKRWIKLKKI